MRTFLVVLLLLVGGGVALGFYQDWLHLTVNKDKMQEDTDGARANMNGLGRQIKEKTEETLDKAREKTGTQGSGMTTATGKVGKVEAADNRFQMRTTGNQELTIYMDASSSFRLNDQQVKMEYLQVGDEVKVAYDVKDGKNLAITVTANRYSASR